MRQVQYIAIGLFFAITIVGWSAPYKIAAIHTKTEKSVIDIQYPQGLGNHIDLEIQKLIDRLKEPFVNNAPMEEYLEKEWNQEWSIDSIKVNFKVKFITPRIVSILFNIQTYGRGAAHPNDSIKTVNFIDGQVTVLEQLFKPNSDYLSDIANYSYNGLLKKDIPKEQELKDGTKPAKTNYSKWYFSKKGLVVVFECSQIMDFENGPESYIVIPYTTLKSSLRTDIEKIIWSNG